MQLDETAFPIVLAGQVGRTGRTFYLEHIRPAADYLVAAGPRTPQERWETEDGYSPSTMAAQIAGLTVAAEIARRNKDTAAAAVYQGTADSWQRRPRSGCSPPPALGDGRYYSGSRATATPTTATPAILGRCRRASRRRLIDAGFLELVRLGVKAPADPTSRTPCGLDRSLTGHRHPSGRMWHRYTFDGYGENADGGPWTVSRPRRRRPRVAAAVRRARRVRAG